MNGFSKAQVVSNSRRQLRCIGFVYGVVSLCFTCSVFAESAVTDDASAINSFGLGSLPEITAHAEVIEDIGLSAITGMGAEAEKLESNDNLAVLLWDERGNGNKRTGSNAVDGSQNYQAINLTVNRR